MTGHEAEKVRGGIPVSNIAPHHLRCAFRLSC
jgi:hypothetical protein